VINFRGTYFDGKNSKAHEVTAIVQGNLISIRGKDIHIDCPLKDCAFESALGGTDRTLYTPEGGRLDTPDTEAFLYLERIRGGSRGFRAVHLLESYWKAAMAAMAIAVLMIIATTVWGIPYLAERAAFSLPDKAVQTLGEAVLNRTDRYFLKPSELDTGEHERIRLLVDRFAGHTGAPKPRVLAFRTSPFGPNAFALPGEIIVLTDELVCFVGGDEELLGVVAHEMAHLERRHAVRTLLQSTGVFVLIAVVAGDVTSITSAAGTLPALLLESGYSRGFEREADLMASRWMLAEGYGVEPMIAFLNRIQEKVPDAGAPEFLSTHPTMEHRIDYLRELAEGK